MPPVAFTGLQPLSPNQVGMPLLVFELTIGFWIPRASALPCTTRDLPGGGCVRGHGDGSCGHVSAGNRRRAGMGSQDPNEGLIRFVHFGKLRGGKGTAVIAY